MSVEVTNLPAVNLYWIDDLLISALGALIAFYFWNWYHSPFLVATRVEQKEVISRKEDRDARFNTRLYVKNIGRVPARNCEASIWLVGRNTEVETDNGNNTREDLYVISSSVGWANRRGSVFANDHRAFSETETIAPGDTGNIELFRQTHTGQFKNSDWVSDGVSIAEIYTDKISPEVEERLGEDFLILGGKSKDDVYGGISGGIDEDDLATTRWEEAEVRIVGENSNIVQQKLSLNYKDGQIESELCQPESYWLRIKIQVRQLLP